MLLALDDERRLYSTKGDGVFADAEAAARSSRLHARLRKAPYCAVLDVGLADEAGALDDAAPKPARALTDLLRRSAALWPDRRIGWLLDDANGEQHRASEWSKLSIRLGDEVAMRDADHFVYTTGYVGAATGALLVAIACRLFGARATPQPLCSVALMSEGVERAVITLALAEAR